MLPDLGMHVPVSQTLAVEQRKTSRHASDAASKTWLSRTHQGLRDLCSSDPNKKLGSS